MTRAWRATITWSSSSSTRRECRIVSSVESYSPSSMRASVAVAPRRTLPVSGRCRPRPEAAGRRRGRFPATSSSATTRPCCAWPRRWCPAGRWPRRSSRTPGSGSSGASTGSRDGRRCGPGSSTSSSTGPAAPARTSAGPRWAAAHRSTRAASGPDGGWTDPPVPWTEEVDDRLVAAQVAERLRPLIDELPDVQRQVVTPSRRRGTERGGGLRRCSGSPRATSGCCCTGVGRGFGACWSSKWGRPEPDAVPAAAAGASRLP